MGFLDATSLKKHFWGFRQVLVDDPSYHMFGISEARFDSTVDSGLINIPVYIVIKLDRNRGGGEILLYAHKRPQGQGISLFPYDTERETYEA